MTLGHPLVDAALDDLRLTPLELKAFRRMWALLDFEHFHEIKADVLGVEIRTTRSYAGAAMRKLVDLGYIEQGERNEKGVAAYRLPRTVPAGGAHLTTSAIQPRVRRQIRNSL